VKRSIQVKDVCTYRPTAGPHKGKRCEATVTEVLDNGLVCLEVRTKDGHFVENVANVRVMGSNPKPGQALFLG